MPVSPVWTSPAGSDAVTESRDGVQQLFHVLPSLDRHIPRHRQAVVLFADHELMTSALQAQGTRGDSATSSSSNS